MSALWNLRLPDGMKETWAAAAEAEGVSLPEFVRTAVTERAASKPSVSAADAEAELAKAGMKTCLACTKPMPMSADVCPECGSSVAADDEMSLSAADTAVVEDPAVDEEVDLPDDAAEEADEESAREPWSGVLGTIGSPTSDGRYLVPDMIDDRLGAKPFLPFSVQPALAPGHEGALNAGRIEQIEYIPFSKFDQKADFYAEDQLANMENLPHDPIVIFGRGTVDGSPAGLEAKRQIDNGADVSLDGLRMDGSVFDAKTFEQVDTASLNMEDLFTGILDGTYLQGLSGKIGGATVVGIGAFEEARVIITASGSLRMGISDTASERFAVLVAAAGPLKPPRAWFENPNLNELTPLTIGKDGRVFGHLCDWNGCHTGFLGVCVPPFHSPSNYAYFNVGELEMAEGDLVPCGKIMFSMDGAGHASTNPVLSYIDIQRYYDDATKVGAFVRAGSDRFGTWLAGTLRPGLSEIEIQHLRSHPPSGDWRPIRGGDSDLIAAFSVPIGGFPIPRGESLVASAGGQITAIITAPLDIAAMSEHNTRLSRRQEIIKRALGTHERTRADIRREAAERLASQNGDDTDWEEMSWDDGLEELAPTAEQRRAWAKSGVAMDDGSYPITKCTGAGTSAINARRAIGRAPEAKRNAVRAHIATREKALGCKNEGD